MQNSINLRMVSQKNGNNNFNPLPLSSYDRRRQPRSCPGSKRATPPDIETIEKTKTNDVISWILSTNPVKVGTATQPSYIQGTNSCPPALFHPYYLHIPLSTCQPLLALLGSSSSTSLGIHSLQPTRTTILEPCPDGSNQYMSHPAHPRPDQQTIVPGEQEESRDKVTEKTLNGQPGQDVVDEFRGGRFRSVVFREEERSDEVSHLSTKRSANSSGDEGH